jgi:hypothetical protein
LGWFPRGEVALIIAGIGKTAGILTDSQFGIGILMTLVTTLIAPPLLNKSFSIKRKGTDQGFSGAGQGRYGFCLRKGRTQYPHRDTNIISA